MCPMITRFKRFFLRKLRCSELNYLLSEVLVTEVGTLSSDLLHHPGQFCLTICQLVKPFKYLHEVCWSLLSSNVNGYCLNVFRG